MRLLNKMSSTVRLARVTVVLALGLVIAAACGNEPGSATTRADTAIPPVGVIDSALPMAEHLRRFRSGLVEPATLDGPTNRATLVRRAFEAIASRDTLTLRALMLSRAEFAYLFFPSNRMAKPPYEMPPALLWFQLTAESNKGLSKAFQHLGPAPIALVSHRCPGKPDGEDANLLHNGCIVRAWRADGTVTEVQLFGSILERGGRFKLLSYANKL